MDDSSFEQFRSDSGQKTGRLNRRRRKRRFFRGMVRSVFWALVLVGVFVLGLGYGRTMESADKDDVSTQTFTLENRTIEATLPTQTETVTTTIEAKRSAPRKSANRR